MTQHAECGVWVRDRLRRALPRGTPLPDADWSRRHVVIGVVALAHVPVVLAFAVIAGFGVRHAMLETFPVLLCALLGCWTGPSRRTRELATTLSLVTSSAVLVHLSGGFVELHFHFFVVVAVVTLYQQWGAFLLAIGFVLLHHGVAGVIDPRAVYNHPSAIAQPWTWAAVHAGFIAAVSAVGLASWKFNEAARARAEDFFRQLYEGEHAVAQQLQETARLKSELVAAASHEFRTPLTAILGFTETLRRTSGTGEGAELMLERVHAQARRLERLVENLLEVDRPLDVVGGSCEAEAAVRASIVTAAEACGAQGRSFRVDVDPGLVLPMSVDAASLVLVNLVTNAIKYGEQATPVEVRARAGGPDVLVEVANVGPTIDPDLRERVYDPFMQLDSSDTRTASGVGLGLHLVRRMVVAHGGRVTVDCEDGTTTFVVRLPAAAPDPSEATESVAARTDSLLGSG